MDGYGLTDDNKCVLLSYGIPGCINYDPISEGSKCEYCDSNSFLNS